MHEVIASMHVLILSADDEEELISSTCTTTRLKLILRLLNWNHSVKDKSEKGSTRYADEYCIAVAAKRHYDAS